MQRREILSGGALAGAGAVGSTLLGSPLVGCVVPLASGSPPALPAPPDMNAFCQELETKLGGISQSQFVSGFVSRAGKPPTSDAGRQRVAAGEKLFQRSLRSLYLSQTFRDLPPESQQHPELQALMRRELPEMDRSVLDMTELLERLSPAEREAARAELKRRPDLGVQIAEAVDEQAAGAGVSVNRRRQLRSMLTQASFRLRHHAPGVLIDEYTNKVRRSLASESSARALTLNVAAQATADLYFAQTGAAAEPAAQPTAASRLGKARTPAQPPPPAPSGAHPGTGTLVTGAWMLGIGLVTFGVSTLLVSAGAGIFLFGMTVGALMFAIGLIVVIVGALIYAAS
jgi:hypothetical protein